jgi:glyoxylase-like metal-dependent hydrolase (beta-lactamase superfamily II)
MGSERGWVEIGDRFFVRRYAFYDQNIGLVLGDGEALVIDTRSTHVQGQEILDHVRELTADPVTVVVDTHGHFDHAFGNRVFRPATIWGQAGCVPFMERTGERRKPTMSQERKPMAQDRHHGCEVQRIRLGVRR